MEHVTPYLDFDRKRQENLRKNSCTARATAERNEGARYKDRRRDRGMAETTSTTPKGKESDH